MWVWAAAAAVASPLAAAVPLQADQADVPRPAVVVLWASWCVTCRAELVRLPALADAARPLRVVTLAIDPPATARRVLTARGKPLTDAFADGRAPQTVLAAWGGVALPLAVAVDAQGRVCGRKAGLLGTDQLKAWAQTCSR